MKFRRSEFWLTCLLLVLSAAQILSYSRSKGLFGGVSLNGSVISPEKSDMEGTYGKDVTAKTILAADSARAPAEVRVFPNTLVRYSMRTAR